MRLLPLVALAAGAALRLPDEMEVDVGCELHVGAAINTTHRLLIDIARRRGPLE